MLLVMASPAGRRAGWWSELYVIHGLNKIWMWMKMQVASCKKLCSDGDLE